MQLQPETAPVVALPMGMPPLLMLAPLLLPLPPLLLLLLLALSLPVLLPLPLTAILAKLQLQLLPAGLLLQGCLPGLLLPHCWPADGLMPWRSRRSRSRCSCCRQRRRLPGAAQPAQQTPSLAAP